MNVAVTYSNVIYADGYGFNKIIACILFINYIKLPTILPWTIISEMEGVYFIFDKMSLM